MLEPSACPDIFAHLLMFSPWKCCLYYQGGLNSVKFDSPSIQPITMLNEIYSVGAETVIRSLLLIENNLPLWKSLVVFVFLLRLFLIFVSIILFLFSLLFIISMHTSILEGWFYYMVWLVAHYDDVLYLQKAMILIF